MMAIDDSVEARWIERILGEYREMPGRSRSFAASCPSVVNGT
jgi:hypothetical protein